MSHRSGLLALVAGTVLGVATAVALGVGAFEQAAAIVVRPVELVDPAPDDPFDLDPRFAPGPPSRPEAAPGPGPGPDSGPPADSAAGPDTVELAGGDVVTIRALDERPLRLTQEDVAFVELAESALGEDGRLDADSLDEFDERDESDVEADIHAVTVAGGAGAHFAVYAVLSESGREAWAPFAAKHANDFLLVEIADRPVDLVRPLGWSRGLRIGVFADELERTRYVESLELEPQ
ncbi:MAG: hypothetical protein U0900_16155 [Myxococcota bacterium]